MTEEIEQYIVTITANAKKYLREIVYYIRVVQKLQFLNNNR
jgi:hypothetical protein